MHTAWRELIRRIDSEENIYEFDLESFFPSVDITQNSLILKGKLNIPSKYAEYLSQLNRSITKLSPEGDELPEDRDRRVLLTPTNEPNPNLDPGLSLRVKEILEGIKDHSQSLMDNPELRAILPSG